MSWRQWMKLEHRVGSLEKDVAEVKEEMVDQKDLAPIARRQDLLFRGVCWLIGIIVMSVVGAIMTLILK